MGKFITLQLHARDDDILLNSDYIVSVRPCGATSIVTLSQEFLLGRSIAIRTDEIEVDDPYEAIKYKLFTDEVH